MQLNITLNYEDQTDNSKHKYYHVELTLEIALRFSKLGYSVRWLMDKWVLSFKLNPHNLKLHKKVRGK